MTVSRHPGISDRVLPAPRFSRCHRIAVAKDELGRLGNVRLIAGMPVEAFIKTGDRSVLSYLTKPMSDQIARTFREK
jgi:hypothetical protein